MAQVSVALPPDLQSHVDARAAGKVTGSANRLRALAKQGRAGYTADVARIQAPTDEGIASAMCGKDAFEGLDGIVAGIRQPHG